MSLGALRLATGVERRPSTAGPGSSIIPSANNKLGGRDRMRHRIIAAVAVLFFAAPPAHAAGQVGRDQVERDQVMRGVAALQRAAQAAVDQGEVPGLSVAI